MEIPDQSIFNVKIPACGRQAEFEWNKKSESQKRELKFELAFEHLIFLESSPPLRAENFPSI
jgi:hypothetical protein